MSNNVGLIELWVKAIDIFVFITALTGDIQMMSMLYWTKIEEDFRRLK